MLLMIDNYDSFTWNLVQYFQQLGQQVVVRRNDDITLKDIDALAPEYLVISPGPGTPDDAGISMAAIRHCAGKVPILGVCLGHQAIAQAFGAKVVQARQVMHGKNSWIHHSDSHLFAGLPNPLSITRYHSLVVDSESLSADFECLAWTTTDACQDELMAFRHRQLSLFGVQFHPEAILSDAGLQLLQHFLQCRVASLHRA
ncbi:aminodeoxychorismate/anthranilate synthase component II [Alkalimonas collagenimarina]|uniref:Aminodeoxychorismate/anthranilate synthase component II n=1 Tax=Alkalimonas collagenimarina TaxID=400390 RepID=A0ABT9H1W6_9GAMM|nr:aminodeoxychorismate/anthranilate synthase component II [Alkalimonas collagenimarina]MDP4537300.1 aminodeoxychorismate/anthranilate synthase component II [Alkalimonas collagenimarina]